MNMKSWYKAW